jgi:hypothetical protein
MFPFRFDYLNVNIYYNHLFPFRNSRLRKNSFFSEKTLLGIGKVQWGQVHGIMPEQPAEHTISQAEYPGIRVIKFGDMPAHSCRRELNDYPLPHLVTDP